ncbi:MAG: cytochrome-c peroxidase [Bradymonadia bacterium]
MKSGNPFKMMLLICLGMAGCDDGDSGGAESSAPDAQISDMAMDGGGGGETDAEIMNTPDAEVDAGPMLDQPYTAILDLPEVPFNYANPEIPDHFRVETLRFAGQTTVVFEDNTPEDNPTTDHGATLGRVLFYDKHLSFNGTVSCASCHKAELGFSDDRVLSEGFEGGDTGRHSMGLANARFYRDGMFFWDQRAATLEEQVLEPFQDPVEMGMTLEGLLERVRLGDYYPPLFESAFGDDEITAERISKALAQFIRSMVSATSPYDDGRAQVASRGDDFPNFTFEENRGKFLFVNPPPLGGLGCFFCHQGEAFIAFEATNNGLDATNKIDKGYGEVTGEETDMGKFKVPSLRNVGLRAPYMHDGRFATLEEVIDHYSDGLQPNPNLGPPFGVRNGRATRLNLSNDEKSALVAFLHTLTDLDMVNDPKFSDPFIE